VAGAGVTLRRVAVRMHACSAMSDYPVGHLIAERVKAMGVKSFYKTFEHDGVRGPNMATVFSDRGGGVRAPVVFYNRSNEAAQQLKPGDFDWEAIFAGGVRWFHSGGIFSALSPTVRGANAPLACRHHYHHRK
jgi:2-dehydro-3-deoxygluconokinase